ncbi:hypothetical protein [Nostoc sp.]
MLCKLISFFSASALVIITAIPSIFVAFPKQTLAVTPVSCGRIFEKNTSWRWQVFLNGVQGNYGIFKVDSKDNKGNFSGIQINQAQNNYEAGFDGRIRGSGFTIKIPESGESWKGECNTGGIQGTVNDNPSVKCLH